MAARVNNCFFTATAGGTTDWTPSAAVTGYMTPSAAGAVSGKPYKYRAENAALTEWEAGEGVWNGTTLARTTVYQNSLGTTAKINFTIAPNVGLVEMSQDILAIEEANSFTSAQKTQAQDNLGIRRVASGNMTWYVSKTGNDANTGFVTGVTSAITFTNGSANIGWTAHGRSVGDVFYPTNSGGGLPTNFVSGVPLYVKTIVDANTITTSLTSGGTALTAGSAGSGTHTANMVSPVLTVQKALDLCCSMDMATFSATIIVAGGQYDQALQPKPTVGGSGFTLRGNVGIPSTVILTNNAAGWGVFYVNGPYNWSISGFRLTASGSNSGAIFGFNGAVINYANIEFGACGNYHIWLNNGSFASMNGNCNVVATGTNIHWLMQQGSRMDTRGMTLTLTGTPAFATTFCQMNDICDILCSGMTFSGAATGSRFVMAGNSVINSAGAAEASYFPGNVAGTKPAGSLWI